MLITRCTRTGYVAFLVALTFLAFLPSGARAQSDTATLSGTIVDSSDAVMPDVEVTTTNLATGRQRKTRTSDRGAFTVPLLTPGRYRVVAQRDGFAPAEVNDLVLNVGDNVAIRVQMKVANPGETVTVVASDPAGIDTSPAVGTVIDRRFIANVPLSGRTFHALLELTPGVVLVSSSGFSVAGQRSDANYFTVDGVGGNVGISFANSLQGTGTGQAPAMTVTGGFNGLVSLDALEEFRIQTSSFSPEYGRGPGAQVTLVTRSGSNKITGSLFEHFRDDAFEANNWFNNARNLDKPDIRQHAFGGTLGGPVVPSRVFYFGSYEGLRLDQPKTLIASVPSVAVRQSAPAALRPLLDAFPLPTRTEGTFWLQEYARSLIEPTTSNAYSARVDTTITARTTAFARVTHTPSSKRTVSSTTVFPSTFKLTSATTGVTHIVGSRALFDGRVNYTSNQVLTEVISDPKDGAAPYPDQLAPSGFNFDTSFLTYSFGNASLSRGVSSRNQQQQVNAVGTFSLVLGAHQVKAGIDYRHLRPSLAPREMDLAGRFNTPESVLANAAALTTRRFRTLKGTLFNLSTFIQDVWRVDARWTFTYGLRWDVDHAPSFTSVTRPLALTTADDLSAIDFAPPDTPLWRTRFNHVAPRVGAAYALDEGGRTMLTGGFGLFFDTGTQGASTLMDAGLFPNVQSTVASNIPVPFPSVNTSTDPPQVVPPYPGLIQSIDPNLRTSRTWQWNAKVERQLGQRESVWIGYVGSRAKNLLSTTILPRPNPRFSGTMLLIGDDGRSTYHALQTQYRRRITSGFQAVVSYTYSRARDNGSASNTIHVPEYLNVADDWGNADFDIRHNFTMALSVDVPAPSSPLLALVFGGWSVDMLGRLRSAAPLTVLTGRDGFGIGSSSLERADVVPDMNVYLDDPAAPGGRRLNREAFKNPADGRQGNQERNGIRGFSAQQTDLGVRRSFAVTSRVRLQFRVDVFNLFNTANFANPQASLTSGQFGLSRETLNAVLGGSTGLSPLYQWGGPRSIEFGVRGTF